MKKLIILVVTLFVSNNIFAQIEAKEGIPLEYNEVKEVAFKVFTPALRINKAKKQSDIDYSKVEGLLQSYFSATDSIWDKSDYLDKNHKSVKDKEHYNSVKKSNKDKEYVEIESIYEFIHNGKKMNYLKYAITIDGLPFQIVSVLSCIQINNRWYIDNLFNQSNILFLIAKVNSEKLGLLFQSDKTANEIVNEIKTKSFSVNEIDVNSLYDFYNKESKNRESKYIKEIRDERNWVENYHYPKAEFLISPIIKNYKVSMPFSLDNAIFSVYDKGGNTLNNTPEIKEKYKNRIEKFLLPSTNETITLIHKLKFLYNNLDCYIIKYKKNGKFYTETFSEDKGRISNDGILKILNNMMLKFKSNIFIDLNSSDSLPKDLEEIRLKSKSQTEDMINLTILNKEIEKNKTLLSKYLDE